MSGYRERDTVEHEEEGDTRRCAHCKGEGSNKNMGCCYRENGGSYGSYTRCCVCNGTGVNRV